tara:strand:- start:1240 stop:1563 length:324 start_codon:yes stop_codon:yes gene_type:complete
MEITGVITKIEDQSGVSKRTGEPFKKYKLILKNNDGYQDAEAFYAFVIFGKAAAAFEEHSYKEGSKVIVFFRIECREFADKWYTDLIGWKVKSALDLPQGTPEESPF